MRWFWIDRFVEFQRGKRAVAVKNVALGEEQVDEYMPGYPVMPATLMIEGLAQTGGLLVNDATGFTQRVVLAKVARAKFHTSAQPGDRLTYTAELQSLQKEGAMATGTAHVEGKLCAEIDLFFGVMERGLEGDLFEPAEFLRILRILRLYDVGRQDDGSPLDIPHMLAAERAVLGHA